MNTPSAAPDVAERLLKAYKVEWDDDEGYARITFASKPSEAKSNVHGFDGCDNVEWKDLRVRRAPEFDQYLGHKITARIYLDHGWWYTCAGCELHLSHDRETDRIDEGGGPYFEHLGKLYCSEACCDARYADIGHRKGAHRGVQIDALDRWPGITIVHANGLTFGARGTEHERTPVGSVAFRFPGGQGVVHWLRHAPTVDVEQRDVDAWEIFSAQCRASRAEASCP